MNWLRKSLLILVLAISSFPVWAQEVQRIALVIGNSNYPTAPLKNPVNDATLMAKTLEGLGFEVNANFDLNRRDMRRAISDFGKRLEAAKGQAVALIYYSGHGIQIDGLNYLIPTDAEITDAIDVKIEGIEAGTMLDTITWTDNRMNIVILDACRNNPFIKSRSTGGDGLARMDAPTGTLLAYSTAPGMVAEDGTGRNSTYTRALARSMKIPGQKVEDVFKRVRVAVLERTNERQVPWESSSLVGDFYFAGAPPEGGQIAALPPEPVEPAPFFNTDIAAAMANPKPAPGGIKALLPNYSEEPETGSLPIDGVWRSSLNDARIRFKGGRTWAVDGYPTNVVMAVYPGQILARYIKPVGIGKYVGDDLPSTSTVELQLRSDMTLAAVVPTIVGPVKFFFTPIALDDPVAFKAVLDQVTGN